MLVSLFLLVASLLSFAVAVQTFARAETIVHQACAFLLLVIAAVLFGSAAIVDSIRSLSLKLDKQKKQNV